MKVIFLSACSCQELCHLVPSLSEADSLFADKMLAMNLIWFIDVSKLITKTYYANTLSKYTEVHRILKTHKQSCHRDVDITFDGTVELDPPLGAAGWACGNAPTLWCCCITVTWYPVLAGWADSSWTSPGPRWLSCAVHCGAGAVHSLLVTVWLR